MDGYLMERQLMVYLQFLIYFANLMLTGTVCALLVVELLLIAKVPRPVVLTIGEMQVTSVGET